MSLNPFNNIFTTFFILSIIQQAFLHTTCHRFSISPVLLYLSASPRLQGTISYTGEGITTSSLEHLCRRFYRFLSFETNIFRWKLSLKLFFLHIFWLDITLMNWRLIADTNAWLLSIAWLWILSFTCLLQYSFALLSLLRLLTLAFHKVVFPGSISTACNGASE